MSDDGRHGLTLIVFVGSVFSPYYAWARRRGRPDPVNHSAFNVALYSDEAPRWSMTERGAAVVTREENSLTIGPSNISWDGKTIDIRVDEVCAPLPRRIRGRIRLTPTAVCERSFDLDDGGMHRWQPFAPCARIEVQLDAPAQRWSGEAYVDSNFGDEPIETGFREWTWSRAAVSDGTVVLYDYHARTSAPRSMALKFDRHGGVREIEPPPEQRLRHSGWRVARSTRADADFGAKVRRTLEDGPFYSRSLLETHLQGEPAAGIHESLSLDRFRSLWVQCLLPFRMPRALR